MSNKIEISSIEKAKAVTAKIHQATKNKTSLSAIRKGFAKAFGFSDWNDVKLHLEEVELDGYFGVKGAARIKESNHHTELNQSLQSKPEPMIDPNICITIPTMSHYALIACIGGVLPLDPLPVYLGQKRATLEFRSDKKLYLSVCYFDNENEQHWYDVLSLSESAAINGFLVSTVDGSAFEPYEYDGVEVYYDNPELSLDREYLTISSHPEGGMDIVVPSEEVVAMMLEEVKWVGFAEIVFYVREAKTVFTRNAFRVSVDEDGMVQKSLVVQHGMNGHIEYEHSLYYGSMQGSDGRVSKNHEAESMQYVEEVEEFLRNRTPFWYRLNNQFDNGMFRYGQFKIGKDSQMQPMSDSEQPVPFSIIKQY